MQRNSGSEESALTIVQQCKEIDRALDTLDNQKKNLQYVSKMVLEGRSSVIEKKSLLSQISATYHDLYERVSQIELQSESGNIRDVSEIGMIKRRLRKSLENFLTLDGQLRQVSREAAERQYRSLNPESTDAEVIEAVSDPDMLVFTQALLSSNRLGQASSTLRTVEERHEAIEDIEQQMNDLLWLFRTLDEVVQQQNPLVTDTEQKAEEIQGNVVKANTEISGAIEKARSRNRKKWWCLLVVLLIIIAIAVVVAVVIINISNKKKM